MKRKVFVAVLAFCMMLAISAPQILAAGVQVGTLAGTGRHGAHNGDFASFNMPVSLFARPGASVIVADTNNNMLRTVTTGGFTRTLAGNIEVLDDANLPMSFLRDGLTRQALFGRPMDLLTDAQNRTFVADAANHVIRMVRGDNTYTYAGSGIAGHRDGSAEEARFYFPAAIATDGTNLFIADSLNHAIRMIDPYGRVTTIAGTPGRHGFSDGPANEARFNTPMGIAVGPDGEIFVADTGNHLIRVIKNGVVETYAGSLTMPGAVGWEVEAGFFENLPIGGFADGPRAEALFSSPVGLTFWNDMLIVADSANHRIRAIDGGVVETLAGTGSPGHADGPCAEAQFHLPMGVHGAGSILYIADTGNNLIRQITTGGDN